MGVHHMLKIITNYLNHISYGVNIIQRAIKHYLLICESKEKWLTTIMKIVYTQLFI